MIKIQNSKVTLTQKNLGIIGTFFEVKKTVYFQKKKDEFVHVKKFMKVFENLEDAQNYYNKSQNENLFSKIYMYLCILFN